jgi:hypothetical protein
MLSDLQQNDQYDLDHDARHIARFRKGTRLQHLHAMYLPAEARDSVLLYIVLAPHYSYLHSASSALVDLIMHTATPLHQADVPERWKAFLVYSIQSYWSPGVFLWSSGISRTNFDARSTCTNGYDYAKLALTTTEIHRAGRSQRAGLKRLHPRNSIIPLAANRPYGTLAAGSRTSRLEAHGFICRR